MNCTAVANTIVWKANDSLVEELHHPALVPNHKLVAINETANIFMGQLTIQGTEEINNTEIVCHAANPGESSETSLPVLILVQGIHFK